MSETTKATKAQKKKQNKDFQTLGTAYIENPNDRTFTALYNALKKPLTAFIYGFVKDPDQAEMVFSDVIVKLVKKKDSFGSKPGRFSTWIYTIARNASLSFMYHRDKWNMDQNDVSDFYDSYLPKEATADHSIEEYSNVTYFDKVKGIEISTTKADIASDLSKKIFEIIDTFDDELKIKVVKTKLTEKITFQQLADKLGITLQESRKLYTQGKKEIVNTLMSNSDTATLKELYYEKPM